MQSQMSLHYFLISTEEFEDSNVECDMRKLAATPPKMGTYHEAGSCETALHSLGRSNSTRIQSDDVDKQSQLVLKVRCGIDII